MQSKSQKAEISNTSGTPVVSARVGQIYRDTYFDSVNDGRQTRRTIKIEHVEGEKLQAVTLTDVLGNILARPRKTRLSLKTLRTGYELLNAAAREVQS